VLAKRVHEALTRRGGTLELSWMNLLEFARITDTSQVAAAESFLEEISPHLAFIEVIPQIVIDREDRLIQGQEATAPHADIELLRFFATFPRKSVDPLNPQGFFADLRHPQLAHMCETFMSSLSNVIDDLRRKSKEDPQYLARVREVPRGAPVQRATRYIYEDAINSLIRDAIDVSSTSNHWRDLFHMVVPVAYCDFVLLDKTWAAKAREVIYRLRKAGHSAEMATVFSKRQMNNFWDAFDI